MALVFLAVALASAHLLGRISEQSRREAFVYRCNELGEGGTFTSRDSCEAAYEQSVARR